LPQPALFTIGHGTRTLEAFLALLHAHGVGQIADVRASPSSRRHPHFGLPALTDALAEAGIAYAHVPQLGGHRRPRPDSIHLGWRNPSFRGYADYMESADFAVGLEQLEALARLHPTAALCAETLPWRCHRALIADALLVRGWRVFDIIGAAPPRPHALPGIARVAAGRLSYPGG
jgi:uncharacterized protein (DUF488 family)